MQPLAFQAAPRSINLAAQTDEERQVSDANASPENRMTNPHALLLLCVALLVVLAAHPEPGSAGAQRDMFLVFTQRESVVSSTTCCKVLNTNKVNRMRRIPPPRCPPQVEQKEK